jgi:hypothetical protein
MKELFIGSEKITSQKDIEGELVEVTLSNEDNSKTRTITITKKLFPYVVTESVSDLTKLREASTEPIMKEILKVLLEYSPKVGEIKYIFERVLNNFSTSMNIADDIVWGTPLDDRRVHEYHKVLMENESK